MHLVNKEKKELCRDANINWVNPTHYIKSIIVTPIKNPEESALLIKSFKFSNRAQIRKARKDSNRTKDSKLL